MGSLEQRANVDNITLRIKTLILVFVQVEPDGSLTEVSKIKVSTRSKENQTAWVGPGMLAIATGEMTVRIWVRKKISFNMYDDNTIIICLKGWG